MLMTRTGLAKRDIISPNLHGYKNRLSGLQSQDKPYVVGVEGYLNIRLHPFHHDWNQDTIRMDNMVF